MSHQLAKKKAASAKGKAANGSVKKNDDGLYPLGEKRFASVSDFKGKRYVNIREYYEKDGKLAPTPKGVNLTLDQFKELIKIIPQLESEI